MDWAWLDGGAQDVESGELTTCVGDCAEALSSSPFVYTQFDDVIKCARRLQQKALLPPSALKDIVLRFLRVSTRHSAVCV